MGHCRCGVFCRTSAGILTDTGRGKLSEERYLKEGKNTKHGSIPTITYHVSFSLCEDFGVPGAIHVKNVDPNEFFLHSVTVMFIDDHGNWSRKAHFDCRSWVYPMRLTNVGRRFFSITSYLPRQTPEALQKLRQEELLSLRGNGRGDRKEWERIYDYAYYNDLGDPSKGPAHERPVLGGSKSYPYPCRLRTGRPLSVKGDVVFLSPPWGGPSYSRIQTFTLDMLKPKDGYLIFQAAQKISPNIIMFLPRNVDLSQVEELSWLSCPPLALKIEENYMETSLKGITAYFGDTALVPSQSSLLKTDIS